MEVRNVLNGTDHVFFTAGDYQESNLWGLAINPDVLEEGSSGFYNLNGLTMDHHEVLSTIYGLKTAAVYIEGEQSNSTIWSMVWIDNSNGMPYKMEVFEPVTLNGFSNEFSGVMTFELLATNISE